MLAAAAAKRTALAVASIAALLAVAIVGPAGGAPKWAKDKGSYRDRVAPTAPANPHVVKVTPNLVYVAWDPSSDNVAVAGYVVSGDGRPSVALSPSFVLSTLGCGDSTQFAVYAYDRSGNRSSRTTTTVSTAACPDTQAPTAPTGFTQGATTENAVVLNWSPSADNVGVVNYGVYRDLVRVATTPAPSVTLTGLSCGRTYSYLFDAGDAAGNRSGLVPAFVQTADCADSEPPSPPTNVSVTSKTASSLALAWSPSSDDTGVAGYHVSVDGTPTLTVTQPTASLSNLACNKTYSLGVDGFDAAGNRSSAASVSGTTSACAATAPPPPTQDTTPPSAPTGLAASNVSQTGLTLGWNASTDNVGVTGYDVYRNGTKVGSGSSTSSTQSGLTCGTAYTFGVVARDAAGNSSSTTQLSAATTACPPPPPSQDTTPPSAPTGLAASNVGQTGLTLGWNASTDNVGVTGYDVYRNGTKVGSGSSTSSTQSGLTCGTAYTFGVVARDAAGNSSSTTQLSAATTACPPPPPAADTTPPSQPASFRIASATGTSVSLAWNASTDNVGVAGYRVYRNGAADSTTTQTSSTVSGLSCGTSYTFDVDAYDAAGNRSPKATMTGSTSACADTQAPSAPTSPAATSRTATSIALGWTGSTDNVGVVGYGLYRNGVQVGTSTSTTGIFSGLVCNTNYTLAVDAYDAAGNRSPKATTMVATTACPDTTPPSTPTGLAASGVSQTGLTVGWNASTDNVGVSGYDVYRNGTKMATVTATSSAQTGLACGTSYSFGVVARDAAGNSSPQASLTAQTSACAAPPPPPPPSAPVGKFVSPSGSDSNPGTVTAPFATVRRLAEALAPGEIGYLRAGTYGDYSTYTPINGNGVTLTSYPGETATLKGYLEINGNSVTVRNLRIDGSNPYTVYPDKCGAQATGIMLDGSDILFEHNEVFQAGSQKGSAILQYGDRNVIRYNKLHDFGECYFYDHGIYVNDGDSVQIYDNWIWNNTHGWGIQVYPGPTNARIHDNVIDANGSGFVISDDGSATTTGNQIYHNVIVNSTGGTMQSGYSLAPAALNGNGPVAGSNNSFTDNAVFNNPVGNVSNVSISGNQTVDPQFVDAGAHNYAVSASSPLASWGLWDGH